jgi:hypothetical protein
MYFTDYKKVGPTWILPTLGRYTVDMRLYEFRKVTFDENGDPSGLEIVPFTTTKGDRMLATVVKYAAKNKQGRLWQEIINLWQPAPEEMEEYVK